MNQTLLFLVGIIIGLTVAMGIFMFLYAGSIDDMAFKDCNSSLSYAIKAINDYNKLIGFENRISLNMSTLDAFNQS